MLRPTAKMRPSLVNADAGSNILTIGNVGEWDTVCDLACGAVAGLTPEGGCIDPDL